MSTWRTLVADNPLLRLLLSSSVRTFTRSGLKSTATAVWLVVGVIVSLAALAAYYAEFLAWQFLLLPLLAIVILIPLAVLHSSIAGEREKRSIEVLLVAPLSSAQIIVAKLSKGVLPVAISMVTFVPIAAAIELGHIGKPSAVQPLSAVPAGLTFTLSMLLLVSSAALSAGVTMFVSSRSRTTAAALIGSLFVLLTWIVGSPILAGAVSGFGGTSGMDSAIMLANPFFTMGQLCLDRSAAQSILVRNSLGLSVALLALSFALIVGAQYSLRDHKRSKTDA
ncbi:MAG: ABC transporter permease [Fimbriimonadaceae bacterium]